MNKLLFLLICINFLLISSCKKTCDDPQSLNFDKEENCIYVDTTQRVLLIKITGTWCPPCGSYGARTMKNNLKKYSNFVGMEVHSRDVMSNPIGDAMLKYLNTSAVPSFFLNGKNKNVSIALEQEHTIGMHLSWEKTNDKINVETIIQAKDDLSGEYSLSIYLMEDGHIAPQKARDHSVYPEWEYTRGRYPKYEHTNILRGEASNNLFGQLITATGMSNNEVIEFSKTLSIDYKPMGKDYPIVAIWKKDGLNYNLVNIISGKDN